jgi:spore germination cell wall hydrolase CwlJ-like protein
MKITDPVPEPEIVKVAKIVDPKQLACLAKNIYFEAGSEPLLGQAAVARVVMNRIKHGFGPNPCSVIYQSTVVQKETEDGETQKVKICQFSWVCEDKTDPNTKSPRYQQAKQVAYDVLAYDAYEDVVPKSTLFFHSVSVAPGWAYNSVKRIGNHIFYSKGKKKTKTTTETQLNNTIKGN